MIPGKEQSERDFEAFLSGDDSQLAALYRKLPRPEPDAKIDAAVLAMAHRALNPELVATPLGNAAVRRRPRWVPAIGLAAGVVLAASVAPRLGPQIWNNRGVPIPATSRDESVVHVRPVEEPAPPPPPASPPPPQQMAEAASAAVNLRSAAVAQPKPAPAPVRESFAEKERQDEAAAKPSLAADRAAVDAKQAEKVENIATPTATPQAFPGQPRSRTEMDATERTQAAARGAWWPSRADQTASPAKPSALQSNASAATKPQGNVAAPASAPQFVPPSPAPAPATMTAVAPEPSARAKSAPADAAGTAVPAESPAVSGEAERPAAPPMTYSTDLIRNSRLYPESWIAAIHRLVRDGRRDEAMRNLDLFRKKYPDYRLPADLERLLPTPK